MLRRALAVLFSTLAVAAAAAAAEFEPYYLGAPGDADCSASVDLRDAVRIARHAAGFRESGHCGEDASGDGAVTTLDARLVTGLLAGNPVPPRLVTLSPQFIPQSSGPTTLTIEGGLFQANTILRWNNTAFPLQISDGGSRATVTIPAGQFTAITVATVRLETPGADPSPDVRFVGITPAICVPSLGHVATMHVDKAVNGTAREVVTIHLSKAQQMAGWTLRSMGDDEIPDQTYTFPSTYIYQDAQEFVEVHSGLAQFPDTQTALWWRTGAVWANSSIDNAELRDCAGTLVATWFDPGN